MIKRLQTEKGKRASSNQRTNPIVRCREQGSRSEAKPSQREALGQNAAGRIPDSQKSTSVLPGWKMFRLKLRKPRIIAFFSNYYNLMIILQYEEILIWI